MTSTAQLFDQLIASLPDGNVTSVQVGAHWTAVAVDLQGESRCGLSASVSDERYKRNGAPAIRDAGRLADRPAHELTALLRSESLPEVSIGMAAVNALLPRLEESWVDMHAEEEIVRHGAGKNVALVGHFPFVTHLRPRVGKLWVLELRPEEGDLPAGAAAEIVPQADVLAVTAMTLINRTFDDLLRLRRPDATVIVLGPSTPLTPLLFDLGVDILSGSVVEDIPSVLRGVSQGANFRQLHRMGVRLVSMMRDPSGSQG